MSSTMNRNVRPENVEFTVKAEEDLVLTGQQRSIVRVPANNMYSCLMQKTQRFSSLFRHYSKHHGLPRESLDFFFTDRLDAEDSPDSVHLQKNDIITVRRRTCTSAMTMPAITDDDYFTAMRQLYFSEEGSDVVLEVGPEKKVLRAHRLILCSRSEIFRAMLKPGSMRESEDGVIRMEDCSPDMVSKMLEYIYSNRVADIEDLTSIQLVDLLTLADQYLLPALKQLCEAAAMKAVGIGNVGRFLSAAENFRAMFLKDYCITYVMEHLQELIDDENFKMEVEECPSMALTILRASTKSSTISVEPPVSKRRRLNMPFDDDTY